jgi:hypothetical protein
MRFSGRFRAPHPRQATSEDRAFLGDRGEGREEVRVYLLARVIVGAPRSSDDP